MAMTGVRTVTPDGGSEYPDEFTNGNGNLTLTDGVKDAITVEDLGAVEDFPPENHPVHRATHEPTGVSEDYGTSTIASGASPNHLREVARRQLARDHPEVLDHHLDGEDSEPEVRTDGGDPGTDKKGYQNAPSEMYGGGEDREDPVTVDSDPAALLDAGEPERAVEAAYLQGQAAGAVELMNLARHFHDKSHDFRRDADRATTEPGKMLDDSLADAYSDAADEARNLARYLDGDREDRPATLAHGEALASPEARGSDGVALPWRSGGDEGGDA